MRIGIVGCGAISGIYLENLQRFGGTEVVACADIDLSKALNTAQKYGIPRASSPEDLLEDEDVELVVNLTVPKAHFPVTMAALKKAKHVYSEKPLALSVAECREILELAAARGLTVGCAPDTVLGAGIQTCRKLVDDGAIGEPVGVNGFMLCPGHESWHPSPEFYYEAGGGPLFDMGPYYLSTMITLFGSVTDAFAFARTTFPTRFVTSQPKHGTLIPVETPTHIVAALRFASGAIGQLSTSFDVQATTLPCLEVYGSEGTLLVPDPNGFGGEVRLFRKGEGTWQTVPHAFGYAENSRGLGVFDMAEAIRQGRAPRAGGELALHVVEIMQACLEASNSGKAVAVSSSTDRPAPMQAPS